MHLRSLVYIHLRVRQCFCVFRAPAAVQLGLTVRAARAGRLILMLPGRPLRETALHCTTLPACLSGCLPAFLPACLPSCLPVCLPAPQPEIRLEVVIGHLNHSKFCIPYLIFFVPPPIFHIPHLIFYSPPPIFYVSLQAVTKKGGFNSTFHHPRWQGQCQSGVHGITGKVYENIRWDT